MKVYYSRSNEVNDSIILPQIEELLNNMPIARHNIKLSMYKRGSTYTSKDLDEADLVIVGLSNSLNNAKIARGTYTEIESAINNDQAVIVLGEDKYTNKIFFQNLYQKGSELYKDNPRQFTVGYGHINLFNTCNSVGNDGREHVGAFIDSPTKIKKAFIKIYKYTYDEIMESTEDIEFYQLY